MANFNSSILLIPSTYLCRDGKSSKIRSPSGFYEWKRIVVGLERGVVSKNENHSEYYNNLNDELHMRETRAGIR